MTHLISSDSEALEIAQKFAVVLAGGASERDRHRQLPVRELDELSESGLLGITVPHEYGGAQVSAVALAEVFRIIAAVDPSVAQIPHSHFVFLDGLRLQGTSRQQSRYFAEAMNGRRFANAQSERGTATIAEDRTTLRRSGTGYLLEGEKFYCTGALFAHWLVVRATLADEPLLPSGAAPKAVAFIARDAPGVTVEDDWDGLGQRTTASGTTRLVGVTVPAEAVVPYTPIFDRPTTYGTRAQLLHAAIDAGIARGALTAGVTAAANARPWFEAGVARASDDPLVAQQAGELELTVRAAEALVREAAARVDAADADLTEESTAQASVATAVAKVATDRAATAASAALFELGGTRTAAASLNLSRFWRDARTHTLHDPSRWKVQHVGRWVLTGTPPPRHGLL